MNKILNKNHWANLKNKGFSLVEMLVVMGIASVASLAVMQIQSSMNKSNARSMGLMERNQFSNLLSISHALPDKCAESLDEIIGSAPDSNLSINDIKIGSSILAISSVAQSGGSQYGGLKLKSGTVVVDGYESGDTLAAAELQLQVEETISGQTTSRSVSVPLALTISNGNISGCSSGSSGTDNSYICSILFKGTWDGENCKGITLAGDDSNPINVEAGSLSNFEIVDGDYRYFLDSDNCQSTNESFPSDKFVGGYQVMMVQSYEECDLKIKRYKPLFNYNSVGGALLATPVAEESSSKGGRVDMDLAESVDTGILTDTATVRITPGTGISDGEILDRMNPDGSGGGAPLGGEEGLPR